MVQVDPMACFIPGILKRPNFFQGLTEYNHDSGMSPWLLPQCVNWSPVHAQQFTGSHGFQAAGMPPSTHAPIHLHPLGSTLDD